MSIVTAKPLPQNARVLSYADALLETMDAALANHSNVFIMGQGVDDFKGIFGSTTGLAQKYGAAPRRSPWPCSATARPKRASITRA